MSEVTKKSTTEKIVDLAKTIQFEWFVGHVVTLASVAFYFLFFRSKSAIHYASYRLAYVGILESFGIILYNTYKSKSPNVPMLIQDSNFQYTFDALIWFLAPRNVFSLFPFIVFSTFHVLGYLKNVILPTFASPGLTKSLSTRITSFMATNNDKSLSVVANAEFLLLGYLGLSALFFVKRSWIVFLAYGIFMKLRYEKSSYTRSVFKAYEVRIDGVLADPRVPVGVKQYWAKAKNVFSTTIGASLMGESKVK